ncbi:MAG TPA: hypothetical protein DIT01_17590 [Lentisphaeria bacterium]|nr:hypothetical protein [Lentisphaeria bacterium]
MRRCMESGIPLSILMSYTGHDTVQMVLEYVPVQDSAAMTAIARLSAPTAGENKGNSKLSNL